MNPPGTVVYVANADSHDITVLELVGDELVERQRFACGGRVMPLAVAPDRRVLHASIRSAPLTRAAWWRSVRSVRTASPGRRSR
jgi:hypothetical protein